MIATNPIVKALKEYKGSNKQSHLHENHWQNWNVLSSTILLYETVLEVVHHVQLIAKNFNSISLIYFNYYWQVIHTQCLLNPQPHSTPYSYKGGGAIWTRAIWQISNTPSLYVTSLWLLKAFSLFNWWCSECFLNQSLHFCAIFGSWRGIFFWSYESICLYHLSSPYKLVVDKDFEVFQCMLFF